MIKYNHNRLREIQAQGLDLVRRKDLDQKKQKRAIRTKINRANIVEAIQVAPNLANVKDLKIERKTSMTGAGRDNDTVAATTTETIGNSTCPMFKPIWYWVLTRCLCR